jgi:hypothetical protein
MRQTLIDKSEYRKYLFYAIGEILIVVIGILFALQVNNLNSNRIKKQNELKSYQNIKRQITDDFKEINQVIEFNDYYSSQFELATKMIVSQDRSGIDTLALIAMNVSKYSDFNRSGNIYETLVNSGDISLMKNYDILSNLQRLEMTYNEINKIEDIHWDIIMKEFSPEIKGVINYATQQVVKPEKLYSVIIQNIFIECLYLTKGKDAIYHRALTEISTITDMINEELDKNNGIF